MADVLGLLIIIFVTSLSQSYEIGYFTNDIIFIQNVQVLDSAEAPPQEPQSLGCEGVCNSGIVHGHEEPFFKWPWVWALFHYLTMER